jgi:hypothetical protein
MKNIVSSLVVLGVVLLVASSCFFEEGNEETATIKLVVDSSRDRTVYTCYAINVIGPGIKTADSRFPVTPVSNIEKHCKYPGISSKLVAPDASSEAVLEVKVPVGSPRLIQVVGMDLTSGTSCPDLTFSQVWKDKADSATTNVVDNSKIYEVGRAGADGQCGAGDALRRVAAAEGVARWPCTHA